MEPMLLACLAAMAIGQPTTVKQELETIRANYGFPALCAGVIVKGKIVELQVVGVRRAGSTELATTNDVWHWGSITKSFTATLVGVLVQQGNMRFDEPLAEVFPELAARMKSAYRKVTPLHLMSHYSGLDGETFDDDMPDFRSSRLSMKEQRWLYTKISLSQPPQAEPGSKEIYANRGYMVLGCGIERITGKPWEDLIREEIFHPLGLASAGFGAPGWDTHTSQPWGHLMENGKLVPVPPGPDADNATVLGPAGIIHMSVPDMLKWCHFQALEGREGGILEPQTFKVLHTPPFGGRSACGFMVVRRDWAGGPALNHSGSNTMNFGKIWIAPKKDFAVAVVTNCSCDKVEDGAEEAIAMLIRRYCPQ